MYLSDFVRRNIKISVVHIVLWMYLAIWIKYQGLSSVSLGGSSPEPLRSVRMFFFWYFYDTQASDTIYRSNLKNRFSIYIAYRYAALIHMLHNVIYWNTIYLDHDSFLHIQWYIFFVYLIFRLEWHVYVSITCFQVLRHKLYIYLSWPQFISLIIIRLTHLPLVLHIYVSELD